MAAKQHSYKSVMVSKETYDLRTFCQGEEEGLMMMFELFPGIYLSHNDFHMHEVPIDETKKNDFLLINYCQAGRCEINLDEKGYLFVEQGYLSIDTSMAKQNLVFPGGRYKGIEFFFDLNRLSKRPPEFFADLNIHIPRIKANLCKEGRSFLAKPTEPVREILDSFILPLPGKDMRPSYRIKLLALLYELSELDASSMIEKKSWMTKGQLEITKAVYQEISTDLSKKYIVAQLAKRYGISETSLRNYFFNVYGQSIPSVIREKRIKKAAKLLSDSDLSVMKIACEIGYENQSKFAAVFKAIVGDSPLEYRRKSKYK